MAGARAPWSGLSTSLEGTLVGFVHVDDDGQKLLESMKTQPEPGATTRSSSVGIRDVVYGENVTVIQPSNLYGCVIGDNTFVGPFVEIQRGVVVGKNCRIQSHSFVCECVTIGNDCFIGHGVMFVNDTFARGCPAGGDRTLWRPTSVGNNVSIGSNATILPVSICDDAVIGAGAVVTKDVAIPAVYAGNPARLLRELP